MYMRLYLAALDPLSFFIHSLFIYTMHIYVTERQWLQLDDKACNLIAVTSSYKKPVAGGAWSC